MGLTWPCGVKTLLHSLEEGADGKSTESTGKTKKLFFPHPTFLYDYKTIACKFSGCSILLPACKAHKCPILINHFLSITLPLHELFSVLGHHRIIVLELFRVPNTISMVSVGGKPFTRKTRCGHFPGTSPPSLHELCTLVREPLTTCGCQALAVLLPKLSCSVQAKYTPKTYRCLE